MKKQEIPAELRWLVENASPGKLITYAAGDAKLATILEHHSAHPSVRRYLDARHVFQLAPDNSTAKAYARSAKSYMVTALLNLYGTQRLGILDPKAKGDRVDKLEHRLDTFRQAHKRERALVAKLTQAAERERDQNASAWTTQWDRANAEGDKRRAAEAQVAELTRERDEAREIAQEQRGRLIHLQAEVTRLTEALAAAERKAADQHEDNLSLAGKLLAAESECAALRNINGELYAKSCKLESECAALRAEVERLNEVTCTPITLSELRPMLRDVTGSDGKLLVHRLSVPCLRAIVRDADEQLAAANALLADCARGNRAIWPHEARAHLAAQPATAPSDADSEVEHARAMTKARRNGGMNRE